MANGWVGFEDDRARGRKSRVLSAGLLWLGLDVTAVLDRIGRTVVRGRVLRLH